MAILNGDIKLLKSEVMLDTTDGGGRRAAGEIIDGQENNLFPDISELDRTYGRISLRKCYPSVNTLDTDSYFGAHAIVAKPPEDPRVSVCLFTTKNWFDTRSAARDRLESYLAPSARWPGHLMETQLIGSRAIQQLMKPGDPLPEVGRTLYLVENEGQVSQFSQYVRISKVEYVDRTYTAVGNVSWVGRLVTITITDPLRYTFHGIAPTPYEEQMANAACKLRDTIVADASKYYSITKLKESASQGDLSIVLDSIFGQLVPSAQTEVPLVDLDAGGQSQALIKSGPQTSISVNHTIGVGAALYIGMPILPGSLTITSGATSIKDDSGVMVVGSTQVGTVEYSSGVVSFITGTYTGTKTVTFTPAAAPVRVMQTSAIKVGQNDRGYVYTINLNPPPPPKSLIVSYMSQGKWYDLRDNGPAIGGTVGAVSGVDSSLGSGTVNYATGSVTVTLGALPDADSSIMFAWSTKGNYFERSNLSVEVPSFRIQVAHPGVIPGSCTVSWPNPAGGAPISVTDNTEGLFSNANATGTINYQTGEIKLIPTKVPLTASVFTVTYGWGTKSEAVFPTPVRDGQGKVNLTLPTGNILPTTMEIEWNVAYQDYDPRSTVPLGMTTVIPSFDQVATVFRRDTKQNATTGKVQGVTNSNIDYVAGTVSFLPDITSSLPKPQYVSSFTGFQQMPTAVPKYKKGWDSVAGEWTQVQTGTTTTKQPGDAIYRNMLVSVTYQDVPAFLPSDGSGYVKVRYLTQQSSNTVTEQYTFSGINLDLTNGFGEKIVPGSVRFTFAGKVYIDRQGQIFTDINTATGAGTLAGSITYTTGAVAVTVFNTNVDNTLTLNSLLTEQGAEPTDYLIFRVPAAPVRSGSFQLRGARADGTTFMVTADTNGIILGDDIFGNIDYSTGIVEVRFGGMTSAAGLEGAFYYNPTQVVSGSIFVSNPVWVDTILYNAVSYTYLPLDADLLGLDPVRLPPDGRVPIFRVGDVAVVHNTDKYQLASPNVGSVYNVGRTRLAALRIVDSVGVYVPDTQYTADLDAGTLTLGSSFSMSGLTAPLFAEHRIEDMGVIQDVQLNGRIAMTRTLTHDFPANTTYVSGALIIGDMQARVHTRFTQSSWTSAWSDIRIGSAPTANFNATLYPIQVTNSGAVEERWACIFITSTTFRVVGENSGEIIASQSTGIDCSPINPATNAPYFTIPSGGWGTGWAAGNVLRFNTAAANFPLWVARTVLQGPPSEQQDGFKLQVRGDVDQ